MNILFSICILIIAAVSLLCFFIFAPVLGVSNRSLLGICLAIFIAQIMAASFFLTSLRAFKTELRIAYRIVAIGILLFTLTWLPLPLASFITLDSFTFSVFTLIALLGGVVIMYIGVRKFSHLLRVKSVWNHLLVVIGLALLFGSIAVLLPHADMSAEDTVVHHVFFGLFVASAGISIPTALLALRMRASLGPRYKSGLLWLSIALLVVALASVHETVIKTVPFFSEAQFNDYFNFGYSIWPFLLSSLLFLKASLSFKQASKELGVLPDNATYLDAINYLANIVSDPAAIDVTLDKVRSITSAHYAGDAFSPQERATLMKVYLEVENYLITKEPLRKISKDDLRELLPETLKQELAKK